MIECSKSSQGAFMSDFSKVVKLSVEEFSDFFVTQQPGYYVDKTAFIKDLVEDGFKVALFTRPRRFGKTLTLSMLNSFLKMDYQNTHEKDKLKEVFRSLAIGKQEDFFSQNFASYPVVYISFKDAYSTSSYEDSLIELGKTISRFAKSLIFLKNSNKLSDFDKESLNGILNLKVNPTISYLTDSIKTLCELLQQETGKKVYLLLDEYDVPLYKLYHCHFYDKFKEIYTKVLSYCLKTNSSLDKCLVTGCLKVSYESIFTGVNNFKCFDIDDQKYSKLFGFTKDETKAFLDYFNLSSSFDECKSWYDGYKFGIDDIFCPWDVTNYVYEKLDTKDYAPKPYWIDSSSNDLVREIFCKNPELYADDLAKLINGELVEAYIEHNLNYQMTETDANLNYFFSLLYMTGYLTKSEGSPQDPQNTLLKIPNSCVHECLVHLTKWCFSIASKELRDTSSSLYDTFRKGSASLIEFKLNEILFSYFSVFNIQKGTDKEALYHAFLNGVFAANYNTKKFQYQSNSELGDGFADISFVLPPLSDNEGYIGVIIEVKSCSKLEDLQSRAQEAIEQIKQKRYAQGLISQTAFVKEVRAYGIAFFKKQCKVLETSVH